MFVKYELRDKLNKGVAAHFKALSHNFPGETEKITKYSVTIATGPRIESGISYIRSRSASLSIPAFRINLSLIIRPLLVAS
jgi:hypothetical protein